MATIQVKNGFDGGSDDQWFIDDTGAGLVKVANPSGMGGWSNFGQSTPTQIPVTNASTQLLSANPSRLYASIMNNSSQTIYIQYSIDAVWQEGYRLCPGAIYVIDSTNLYTGIIKGITETGSVNIDVIEGVM